MPGRRCERSPCPAPQQDLGLPSPKREGFRGLRERSLFETLIEHLSTDLVPGGQPDAGAPCPRHSVPSPSTLSSRFLNSPGEFPSRAQQLIRTGGQKVKKPALPRDQGWAESGALGARGVSSRFPCPAPRWPGPRG